MTEVKTGIKITGKLDPSVASVLRQLVGETDKASDSQKKLKKSSDSGLKAIVGWNQGLSLAKKAIGLLGKGFDATVGKSIGLRAETNANRVQWEGLGHSIDKSSALIGDLMLPAAMALRGAFADVASQIAKMSDEEREAIAIDIAGWAVKSGTALVKIVGGAAQVAGMAINGLRMAWHAAGMAGNTFLAKLSQFSGQGFFFGKAFRSAADESEQAMMDANNDLKKWEETIKGFEATAVAALNKAGDAAVKTAKRLGAGIVGKNLFSVPGEDAKAHVTAHYEFLAEKARQDLARDAQSMSAKIAHDRQLHEAKARNAELQDQLEQRQNEKALERAREQAQKIASIVSTTLNAGYSGIKGVIGDIIERNKQVNEIMADTALSAQQKVNKIAETTKSAGEIMAGFFLSVGEAILDSLAGLLVEWVASAITKNALDKATALGSITASAAAAGAAAFAAYQYIPFAGPVIGAAAATLASAETMGWAGMLAFAHGGIVPGAVPGAVAGRDSVPAMLTPGEGVLTTQTMGLIARDLRQPGGGGGGQTTVNVKLSTLEKPTTSRWESIVERDIGGSLRKGQRTGKVRL